MAERGLVLPHPRLHERAFVLVPLRETSPDWVHPVSGRSAEELLEAGGPWPRVERWTEPSTETIHRGEPD